MNLHQGARKRLPVDKGPFLSPPSAFLCSLLRQSPCKWRLPLPMYTSCWGGSLCYAGFFLSDLRFVFKIIAFSAVRSISRPNSSCEMIVLRNNSHGAIVRVCVGIFSTASRNKNVKFSMKIRHLTSTEHRLLSDRLLRWRETIELSISRFPTNNLEMDN